MVKWIKLNKAYGLDLNQTYLEEQLNTI